jgi:hypothetical protein
MLPVTCGAVANAAPAGNVNINPVVMAVEVTPGPTPTLPDQIGYWTSKVIRGCAHLWCAADFDTRTCSRESDNQTSHSCTRGHGDTNSLSRFIHRTSNAIQYEAD